MVSEVKKQNKPELIKKNQNYTDLKKKIFFLHVFRFTHGKIHRKKKKFIG